MYLKSNILLRNDMKLLNSWRFSVHFKVRIQISKGKPYTITQKQRIGGIIYQNTLNTNRSAPLQEEFTEHSQPHLHPQAGCTRITLRAEADVGGLGDIGHISLQPTSSCRGAMGAEMSQCWNQRIGSKEPSPHPAQCLSPNVCVF